MGKRAVETNEEEIAEVDLAAKKAAKKAKKAAAVVVAEVEEEDPEAVALAAKKAAKKAKKAAALAAPEGEAEEEDLLSAKKAAKKAKKLAAAEVEAEEEDPAAALAAKKAAKKAKKAAALAAAEKEEEEAEADVEATPAKKTKEETPPTPKKEETEKAKAGEDEEWKDNTYKCIDCSADWVDTADDQEFRWSKGFAETPKRCKDCRWAKKVRMEGGDPTEKGKGKGKKGKDAGGNENTVFVRGLPFATTEEALNKDFAECGEIVTCRMPLNDEGSCQGIAFIKYTDKESMDKAIAFNETDYGGRTIFVVPAADKPEGKGKGKDGKGKDGKDGKGKGKDGKGKKGKKGKASSEAKAKTSGAMVESTGTKQTFADSDDE